jgi:hypothetical protein
VLFFRLGHDMRSDNFFHQVQLPAAIQREFLAIFQPGLPRRSA